VLYVEDEESDTLFMQRAFAKEGLGAELRVVADGRAAIHYLSGAGEYQDRGEYPVPALVLLDLNVPRVSAFDVLSWMRQNPNYATTPVVLFSSAMREEDEVKAREMGASGFLEKPTSGLKFGDVVRLLREKWLNS
jgi:DNA-binding response OmpR family regulator